MGEAGHRAIRCSARGWSARVVDRAVSRVDRQALRQAEGGAGSAAKPVQVAGREGGLVPNRGCPLGTEATVPTLRCGARSGGGGQMLRNDVGGSGPWREARHGHHLWATPGRAPRSGSHGAFVAYPGCGLFDLEADRRCETRKAGSAQYTSCRAGQPHVAGSAMPCASVARHGRAGHGRCDQASVAVFSSIQTIRRRTLTSSQTRPSSTTPT